MKPQVTLKNGLGIIDGLGIIAGLALGILAIAGIVFSQKAAESADNNWTDTFPIEEFSSAGVNPFFILKPGYFLILEGTDNGKKIQLRITVLDETKTVDGVETRVVEERERNVTDDKLIEVSRNYFAIGKRTNTVYYFGEDVDMYKNNQVTSHEGSWLSGIKGAKYGVLMPGIALAGSRYYQEIAPGVAMDRAENVSLTERVETPAGSFKNCLKVRESTPLESTAKDFKIYSDGIGLVQENDLKLIEHGKR
jgi:hypothetical protein